MIGLLYEQGRASDNFPLNFRFSFINGPKMNTIGKKRLVSSNGKISWIKNLNEFKIHSQWQRKQRGLPFHNCAYWRQKWGNKNDFWTGCTLVRICMLKDSVARNIRWHFCNIIFSKSSTLQNDFHLVDENSENAIYYFRFVAQNKLYKTSAPTLSAYHTHDFIVTGLKYLRAKIHCNL